jgi:hypothetical protein
MTSASEYCGIEPEMQGTELACTRIIDRKTDTGQMQ